MNKNIALVTAAVVALLALALPLSGAAAPSRAVQPGLWEIKVSLETVDSEPARRKYEALKKIWQNLKPEERKKVEATVPRPGVPLLQTHRVCITAEQAREGPAFSGVEEDEDCRTEYGEAKGGRIPAKMTCEEQPLSAVGEVVFAGPKGWSMNMRTTMRAQGEPPTESVMRTESRWLSSDCGSVKPEKD